MAASKYMFNSCLIYAAILVLINYPMGVSMLTEEEINESESGQPQTAARETNLWVLQTQPVKIHRAKRQNGQAPQSQQAQSKPARKPRKRIVMWGRKKKKAKKPYVSRRARRLLTLQKAKKYLNQRESLRRASAQQAQSNSSKTRPDVIVTVRPAPGVTVQPAEAEIAKDQGAQAGAAIKSCDERPCENGGKCTRLPTMTSGQFLCVCPAKRAGLRCEKERDDCVLLRCTTISDCTYLADGSFCVCNAPSYSGLCLMGKLKLTTIEKVKEFDESVRFGPIFFTFLLGLYGIVTMFLYCKWRGVSDKAWLYRKRYKKKLKKGKTPSEAPPDTLDVYKSKLPCCATPSNLKPGKTKKKVSSKTAINSTSTQQINNNRVSKDPSQTHIPSGRHDDRYTSTYSTLPRQRSATVYKHKTSLTSPVASRRSEQQRSRSRSEGRPSTTTTYPVIRQAESEFRTLSSRNLAYPRAREDFPPPSFTNSDSESRAREEVIIPLIEDERLRQRASVNYGSNNAACYGYSSSSIANQSRYPFSSKYNIKHIPKDYTSKDNHSTFQVSDSLYDTAEGNRVRIHKHPYRRYWSYPNITFTEDSGETGHSLPHANKYCKKASFHDSAIHDTFINRKRQSKDTSDFLAGEYLRNQPPFEPTFGRLSTVTRNPGPTRRQRKYRDQGHKTQSDHRCIEENSYNKQTSPSSSSDDCSNLISNRRFRSKKANSKMMYATKFRSSSKRMNNETRLNKDARRSINCCQKNGDTVPALNDGSDTSDEVISEVDMSDNEVYSTPSNAIHEPSDNLVRETRHQSKHYRKSQATHGAKHQDTHIMIFDGENTSQNGKHRTVSQKNDLSYGAIGR